MIQLTANGLYCAAGDFFIDPERPVPRAVITHAHGDHARFGHTHYWMTPATAALARIRLGDFACTTVNPGVPFAVNGVELSFHSAGHLLGSAQVRIRSHGQTWVVTGDFKRHRDPSCEPFEVVPCDTLITEASFALPLYRWPPMQAVCADIVKWCDSNPDGTCVLECYALGKAQRILAELATLTNRPVHVHPSIDRFLTVYRDHGIALGSVQRLGDSVPPGSLILAPPKAVTRGWLRRWTKVQRGFASGWMQLRAHRRERVGRGFVISDHADWDELNQTVVDSGAQRVLCIHGDSRIWAEHLSRRYHVDARPMPETQP
ncbi:ligase-associated DNA damage response exonuclease [Litorivicinus lipolyticus]|uniref:Ligase-associated DNA damage response exonuclease n=1 Tax=Litorivicinus lipolyticus TaxID=418701 RepID=A0A5Q2QFW5_9GAMM|nr:ligase-associated DNA damage response exonuclease [Litorivicinus lipolyticus]QGG80916.1 ligase-associated DNA damage response exonuclease [Litorivicinus lipolyticus]